MRTVVPSGSPSVASVTLCFVASLRELATEFESQTASRRKVAPRTVEAAAGGAVGSLEEPVHLDDHVDRAVAGHEREQRQGAVPVGGQRQGEAGGAGLAALEAQDA